MRLLPRMRAHVRDQNAGRCERLAARLADMRLPPRMCPHVNSQAAGLGERLAACLTDMLCSHVWWGGKGGQGNGEDQFNSKVDKLFLKKNWQCVDLNV